MSDEPPAQPQPGVYKARIVEAEPRESKKGLPTVQLTLQLLEGLGGATLMDPEGRPCADKIRYETISITQEAAFRVKQLCSSARIPPPESQVFGVIRDWVQTQVLDATVIVKTRLRMQEQGASAGKSFAVVDAYLTEDKAMVAINQAGAAATPKRQRPKRAQ